MYTKVYSISNFYPTYNLELKGHVSTKNGSFETSLEPLKTHNTNIFPTQEQVDSSE